MACCWKYLFRYYPTSTSTFLNWRYFLIHIKFLTHLLIEIRKPFPYCSLGYCFGKWWSRDQWCYIKRDVLKHIPSNIWLAILSAIWQWFFGDHTTFTLLTFLKFWLVFPNLSNNILASLRARDWIILWNGILWQHVAEITYINIFLHLKGTSLNWKYFWIHNKILTHLLIQD